VLITSEALFDTRLLASLDSKLSTYTVSAG
jgi:hypothetical protein